ncbi:YihY/virulence factor BrkB family protein [Alteromonas sp. C1M14]|uniref:YihY/virulence factor BrkB family protein n=1 Tax=Alteromonas sp. C1M14 TaxID=2841567 RepID=UPI001C082D6E|nr:YihY/virulence factor BrkB family protein [Alteromonas sp. C1M14]MBU2980073.1 YihY/virulence factor BrkB family protein [Alteromonas sp. C1M14]
MPVSQAKSKSGISDFPAGAWWQIVKRTYTKQVDHNLSLISAGVAFYFLLAIFPLLAGIISLYGLLVSPEQLQSHMGYLVDAVPTGSGYILEEQLTRLTENSNRALSWGFGLSLLLTLWSSSKGANALITACNIAYNEEHGRNFLKGILARLVLTISIILLVISALLCISVLPEWISWVAGPLLNESNAMWITWPVLMLLFNVGLAGLYRYGPHRRQAKWRWVTVGSAFATIMWLIASYAFSFYLNEFASYNKTYGSVGGIVILLMWFFLSAYIILLGAELNSATEYQTDMDSTAGKDKPKGERGAYVADHSPSDSS